MIRDIFLAVLEISVAVGGIAAVCMVALPIFNKRFAAKWSYYIWIFLAVRLLVPMSVQSAWEMASKAAGVFQEKTEVHREMPLQAPRRRIVIEVPPVMTAPIAPPENRHTAVTALDIAAYVWLFGCGVCLLFPTGSYLCYRRRMLRETYALGAVLSSKEQRGWEAEILAQMHALSEELHIRRLPPVRMYGGSISPMIMGIFRPVLVLPEGGYSEQELYFILKHELIHVKRHDVAVKFLLVAAGALHWFNPFIHLMKRRAVVDMELSCDERVIRGIAYADRKAYTETLFSTIQAAYGKRTYLLTQFYGGKEIMKRRFRNIFTRARKKNGMPLLVFSMALTLTAGALISCGVSDAGADGSFHPVVMRTGGGDARTEDEGMSDEKLCELAKQYFAVRHAGKVPQFAEIDGLTDEGLVKIHLYDIAEDNSVAMTMDWYTVDRKTGIGEDVNFETVNLLETAAQTDADTKEEVLYGQMAGTWSIDFERTENLWGSGISYGNEMKIAADGYGSFSYYIGIGVGGTGKCEIDGDALKVEVEPYEDHTEGTEALTLRYVHEKDNEWILMDWYGEEVYWMRAVQTVERETTLTFMKEGKEEKKQAELVYGAGFGLYLPVDEWQMSAPDQWTSTVNEQVSLWVAQFQASSADGAWKELEKNGYPFENGELLQENGTMMLKIKLFETVGDGSVWGVFYRYPAEAEEGWGQELSVIADTFGSAATIGYADHAKAGSAEGEAIHETAEAFAEAYFGGDADALRAYLADTFEGKAETYEGTGTVEVLAVRGLGTEENLPAGSTKEISLEFLDSTEDSYTYLTLGFVKQAEGWKVQWYGLEK